jgi:pSer/pThr/pTyr-binding forkhead associated (FHA) protein
MTEIKGKFLFLTGSNKGNFFFIRPKERIVIGRDQTCNISIDDSKTSREHAELTWNGEDLYLTDLKSQNGVILNDKKILQSKLEPNDRFVIGKTIIRFDNIERPPQKTLLPDIKNSENVKKSIGLVPILGVFLVISYILFDSEQTNIKKVETSRNKVSSRSIASSKIKQDIEKRELKEDKEVNRKVGNILRRGLRELREGNYFRAISEFNQGIDLKADDPQSHFYLRKSLDELDKVIQQYNIDAQRSIASLNEKKALVEYCSIIRLLQRYPDDERYKSATENIKKIQEKLDEESEAFCLQE